MDIYVFLDGDLVYDGNKEGFIRMMGSLSGTDKEFEKIVDKALLIGNLADDTMGDFEIITQELFHSQKLTLEEMAIRSYERQLEDCVEKWREEILNEIELLRSGAIKKEW